MHTVVNQAPTPFDASTIGFTAQYSKFMPYITGLTTNFGPTAAIPPPSARIRRFT
jgi:hypothetical protein